ETEAARIRDAALACLTKEPALRPQYVAVVDQETMAPVTLVTPGRCALAIACQLGNTRLIDNTLL
ncbi:MAG: Pantoate-beta-alanine ligase, partial [Verrucomicrobiota bacterium]